MSSSLRVFLTLTYFFVASSMFNHGSPRPYRYCSEGCCPHEFCAFQKICYPKMHCEYGCPDGSCEKGICMPQKPCHENSECTTAHACATNFNLGYRTCQYNLDIGSTLCVDRNGNPNLKYGP
ncbi:hypothetical protein ACJMK2_035082 [Sinanodonta woodiana]|uniref:Uncharacterized protein n=1 Tax=Sinanodonta woodiana TaxID=1069815 RepID=A0ABD3WXR7_SINWO